MILNLRRWVSRRYWFYSVVGLFAIGSIYIQVAQYVNEGGIAIAGTRTEQKVVAMTFDHSWGNRFTPSILDTLQKNELKVTFFIMGPWAKKYVDVAKRMVADGHEIGSHGFKHENYGDMTEDWVKNDIRQAHELIKEACGAEPSLIRPPNGHYSQRSLRATKEMGYKTIIWNADSLDWKNPGRDVIVDRVVKRLKPGAIILLHASDTPVQTADALPILVEKIKQQGYKIVTVGELLAKYAEGGLVKH